MAHPGAIAHSRAHPCPLASTLSLSSLVSPLRPLGLGLLGRCDPRSFFFYDVTDAGPASHRVRLWQGGPASTYCRFVSRHFCLRVLVFFKFGYWVTLNFARAPGLSEAEGRWQWRSLRPLALPSFVARSAPLRCTPDAVTLTLASLCSLCSDGPLSSRPQPLGSVGDDTPARTREDFGLSV